MNLSFKKYVDGGMVFTKYFKLYGSQYIKVGISSVVLMMIGFTIFYAGYVYINEVLIFPPSKFFNTPEKYLVQRLDEESAYALKVKSDGLYISTPGSSEEYRTQILIPVNKLTMLIVEVSVANYSDYIVPPLLALSVNKVGADTVYSSTFSKYKSVALILRERGTYNISITVINYGMRKSSLETSNKKPFSERFVSCLLRYRVLGYYPKQEYIIAKWMQGLGTALFSLGVIVFLLSPLIVSRYAAATYTVTPEDIRRELVNLGVMQLFRSEKKQESREQ